MAHHVRQRSNKEDSEECTGESVEIEAEFSELSSYYSGIENSSSEVSSSEMSASTGTNESSCDDEETTDYETDETSDISAYSTHSSDTSFQLSTLIEESDRQKLEEFVRLRPVDKEWICAAWNYFDNESTYRRISKVAKVVRKIRGNLRPRNNWTELYREYCLRHPLSTGSILLIDKLKRLSLDPPCLPLPDLTV